MKHFQNMNLSERIKHSRKKQTPVFLQLLEENKRLNKQVIDYKLMNLKNCQQRMYVMRELSSIEFNDKEDMEAIKKIYLKLIEFANGHEL